LLSATGDLGGSEVGARIGLGAEYRMNSQLDLVARWRHQDAGHITIDHFTLGVNYHFRAY
jgi:opacity protein-like surface antigen